MELAATTLILFLIVTSVLFAVHVAIPFLGRAIATTIAHNLRDDVFELCQAQPELRELTLFQDLDHIQAFSLHVIRDGTYRAAVRLFMPSDTRPKDPNEARDSVQLQYQADLKTISKRDADKLWHASGMLKFAVGLRVVTGHWAILSVFLVSLVPLALLSLLKRAMQDASKATSRTMANALSTLVSMTEESPRSQSRRQLLVKGFNGMVGSVRT